MNRYIKELLGYFVASILALAVDVLILWLLVQFAGWFYLAAATISFLAGAVVAYAISVNLVFRQHRFRDRHLEFVSFVAIGTLALALNAGIISVAVGYFGLHYLLAKCIAAAGTFFCNFVARRQILFITRSSAA